MQIFTAALFVFASNWRHLKYPSTGEWINKLWPVRKLTDFSVIKRNRLLAHTITWRDLKCVMLTEMNYTQKAACCRIPYVWHSGKNEIIRMENRIRFCPRLAIKENIDHKGGTGEILRVMKCSISFFFFLRFLFIHERQRERGRDPGRGRSRFHAGSLMQDLIPGLVQQLSVCLWLRS